MSTVDPIEIHVNALKTSTWATDDEIVWYLSLPCLTLSEAIFVATGRRKMNHLENRTFWQYFPNEAAFYERITVDVDGKAKWTKSFFLQKQQNSIMCHQIEYRYLVKPREFIQWLIDRSLLQALAGEKFSQIISFFTTIPVNRGGRPKKHLDQIKALLELSQKYPSLTARKLLNRFEAKKYTDVMVAGVKYPGSALSRIAKKLNQHPDFSGKRVKDFPKPM